MLWVSLLRMIAAGHRSRRLFPLTMQVLGETYGEMCRMLNIVLPATPFARVFLQGAETGFESMSTGVGRCFSTVAAALERFAHRKITDAATMKHTCT